MKRDHSAYPEYFIEPPAKDSKDWTWKVLIHRLPKDAGPTEELTGAASTQSAARDSAQKAIADGMKKHLKPKEGK